MPKKSDAATSKESPKESPRDKILDTAIRLFCRDGINATGIDRIIEDSGVARMTLYNQFGSKDGLVQAALERDGEIWRTWFSHALKKASGAPRERLLAVFDALEEWFSSEEYYGCAFINAVAEHQKSDNAMRKLALAHKREVLAEIKSIAAAAGAPDPTELAHQLGMLMDGAIVVSMVTRNPDAAKDAKAMAGLIIDAALTPKNVAAKGAATAA